MKVGDLVRIRSVKGQPIGIVAAKPRYGVTGSYVDVFVNGFVVTFDLLYLRLIRND